MRHVAIALIIPALTIWFSFLGLNELQPTIIGCSTAQASEISPPVSSLRQGPTLTVKSVGYGASFDLSNGRRVRLLSIRVPKPNSPPFTKSASPLGAEAKAFVDSFVHNHSITLYFDNNDTDRYGRWLAHVVRDDGVWLQQALLERGLAQVYSFPDNRWGVNQLLAFEKKARKNELGIWALPYYRLQTPDTITKHIGTFQVIEGRVLSQSHSKGAIYLNFGPEWKTDFTLRISKKYRKNFMSQVIHKNSKEIQSTKDEIQNYAGQRVRARGWVSRHNGPMIDLTHPEQIELLSTQKPFK